MKKFLLGVAIASLFAYNAEAATLPSFSGPAIAEPNQILGTLNTLVNTINANIPALGSTPRNLLDNGSMQVNQRAATATCATTSGIAETSYSADRWGCDVNMASGAGQMAVVTSSPSPPLGFVNSQTVVRNSGALGQPVCAMQELPTVKSTQMQGQTVVFSTNMQALGGLAADNGNLAQLYVLTGTGAAQGLGSLRSGVGMTTTIKAASVTVATTGIITYTQTFVAGQPVYFTATTMPTGITSGQLYYVSSTNLSGTQFSVASTYAAAVAGTVLAPTSTGNTVVVNASYITPVWTGLAVYGANGAGLNQTSAQQAFGQATAQAFTLSSTGWGRFSTGPIFIGSTVTEVAVAACFFPNAATSGGATDGFAFTGAQLEIIGLNQLTATPFEFRELSVEQQAAYRYAYAMPEPASGVAQFNGNATATTTCEFAFQFPQPMDVAPTLSQIGVAIAGGTTYKTNTATGGLNNVSAMAVKTANSVNSGSFTVTSSGMTAGQACTLEGLGGGAIPLWGADF